MLLLYFHYPFYYLSCQHVKSLHGCALNGRNHLFFRGNQGNIYHPFRGTLVRSWRKLPWCRGFGIPLAGGLWCRFWHVDRNRDHSFGDLLRSHAHDVGGMLCFRFCYYDICGFAGGFDSNQLASAFPKLSQRKLGTLQMLG